MEARVDGEQAGVEGYVTAGAGGQAVVGWFPPPPPLRAVRLQ
jgi:hypothetical protein